MDYELCDVEKAYQNGRADMKKEIIDALTDIRENTLGAMNVLLTGMIEKVAEKE